MELIATSTFGLEAVVARELRNLGYEPQITQPGRVEFVGDAEAIVRANLWLRTADRVLVKIGRFEARDFESLFDGVKTLAWHEWIGPDAAFVVNGRSVRSQLSSVPAVQRATKRAMVDALLAAHGVSELPETGAGYSVEVALLNDTATFTLDTSGAGLHKRGYRDLVGPAPLRETLAAALVLLSFWQPDRPLIDPFCGSGTIPIEAAMIGRRIPPGLCREFAAEQWPQVPEEMWEDLRESANGDIIPALDERIMGYDLDEQVLELARRHARRAGVADDVHLQQADFASLSSKRQHGCIITNPPYGKRLGAGDEAAEVYRAMPEVLRRLPTWSHFVLTAVDGFERIVGQTADRRRKLYNGRIECTYYQFHGPPPGKAATRDRAIEPVFGGRPEGADRQADEFASRLKKRARHLRRWPGRGITCYRLYERDVPDVPLAVDVYDGRLHIVEFERPNEHTPAQHAEWRDLMVRTAGEALGVPADRVHYKDKPKQRGTTQHEKVGDVGRAFVVTEQGLKFEVNLTDYIDTGLFLDHRQTRAMVRDEAAGKRFVNLFAYTGSFSVYAAAGGAASTTTVDLSGTYLDWAKRNMALNGFGGDAHRGVREDALGFIGSLGPGAHFDLAMVDPPTFSNSKRLDSDWDVQKDHGRLLAGLAKRMSRGGVVYFSTNFRRFKLDESALGGFDDVREISKQTVPEDFRNRRVHRCWRLVSRGPA